MQEFHDLTYLAQLRALREIAELALKRYSLGAAKLHFIHYGENATYRVHSKNGTFLLRINRSDYHTKVGIEEEIEWLNHLTKDKNFLVPKPVASKRGFYVETVEALNIAGLRHCSLFKWTEGRFLRKSLKPKHMYDLGQLIAKIQGHPPLRPTKSRRYWTSEGLVGKKAKFGTVLNLKGLTKAEQRTLNKSRIKVFKKLRAFEKAFPDRQGFIHADLHFGNVFLSNKKMAAIDFDDCGFGFHLYDLAVPLISAEQTLGKKRAGEFHHFKTALIDGYSSLKKWDQHDEKILPYLVLARRIVAVGWLYSRRDNPRIRKFWPKMGKENIRKIEGQMLPSRNL
jgi:Ser/Thr protein kinase RdoA (MazF antagonist)